MTGVHTFSVSVKDEMTGVRDASHVTASRVSQHQCLTAGRYVKRRVHWAAEAGHTATGVTIYLHTQTGVTIHLHTQTSVTIHLHTQTGVTNHVHLVTGVILHMHKATRVTFICTWNQQFIQF